MLITTDTLEEYLPYYLTKDRKEGIEKGGIVKDLKNKGNYDGYPTY